jgi:hypothetical protein
MDEFLTGSDWQVSSEPYLTIRVPVTDLWPEGLASEIGGGNKDTLDNEAGQHPILAVGAVATRPHNIVGVVVSVHNGFAVLNVAPGAIVHANVANITGYGAVTYAATFAIGQPVYIDDSAALTDGVTLSLSALNSAGSGNPLAGYLFYDQDEYVDSVVGGANAAAVWPVTADVAALVEVTLPVLLVGLHD